MERITFPAELDVSGYGAELPEEKARRYALCDCGRDDCNSGWMMPPKGGRWPDDPDGHDKDRVRECECAGGRIRRAMLGKPQKGQDFVRKHQREEADRPIVSNAELDAITAKLDLWIAGFDRRTSSGLLLIGPTGTGKSRFARRALSAVRTRGANTDWIDAADLIDRLVQAENSFHVKWQDVMDAELKGRECVVIDDLGAEYLDARNTAPYMVERMMNALVEGMHGEYPVPIITTNILPKQLVERYGSERGPRIKSRLAEVVGGNAGGGWISFGSQPDRRTG